MSKKMVKTQEELLQEALVPVEEQPYEIPDHWQWSYLKNHVDLERGITFPASAKGYVKNETNVGCARTSNIQETFVWDDMIYVDKHHYKKNPNKLVRVNDILMSTANSYHLVGKVSYIHELHENITFGGFLLCIRAKQINPKYLFYYLKDQFNMGAFQKLSSQTTNIANINASKIESLKFPLPPLNEQKRIADKVERLLGKVNQAKQLIEEAKQTFELRRAAILDKAFRGELTKKWRDGNPNSGKVSLVRISNKIKSLAEEEIPTLEIPDNWKWIKLGEIFKITSGGTPSRAISKYYNGNIPWIKTGEIIWNNIINSEEKISEEAINNSSAKLLPINSVLVAMYGQGLTRGRAAILQTEAACNQAVCALLPNEQVLPEFLFYYFMEGYHRFRKIAQGGNQENLSGSLIANFPIAIPSIEEQSVIVEKVNELFKMEYKVQNLLNSESRLDELNNSILSKAFKGELGTSDSTDESVLDELLNNIKTI